jgi:ABC-type Mn2+/Zn2+ transport system ATPase subunit
VEDVVMMGRYGQLGRFEKPGEGDKRSVEHALQQMGISGLVDEPIGDLSGGQQQRVFLARALAQEPHILLLDEPFTGVDLTTQEATLELLDKLRENHVTVMVSTHDLSMAADRFELVLLLNHRVIAYGKPEEVFTPANVREAFGGQVLRLEGTVVIDQCCPPGEEEHRSHP